MKKLKKALSLTMAMALSLAMAVPAFAWVGEYDVAEYEASQNFAEVYEKYRVAVNASAEPVGATIIQDLPDGVTDPNDAFYVLVFQFPENTTFTPKGIWVWGTFAELDAQEGGTNTATLTGTENYYNLQLYEMGEALIPGTASDVANLYVQVAGSTAPAQPEQPTQPEQPVQPSVPAAGTYTVKPGDTWSSICTNFYGSNAQRTALQKANKGVKFQAGAVITLPEKLGNAARIPAPTAGAGEKLYTVKAGDTLGKIAAAEYGQTALYKAIFERNADRLKNANTIYEGQVIVLPAKG